jgi:hypothetical protein
MDDNLSCEVPEVGSTIRFTEFRHNGDRCDVWTTSTRPGDVGLVEAVIRWSDDSITVQAVMLRTGETAKINWTHSTARTVRT